jgi:hypothetical protein
VIGKNSYNTAYFWRGKFFRIFRDGKKLVDIPGRSDVISFFKQLEENA